MNMELMERVAQWLEAGAPHEMSGGMGFDMQYIGVSLEDYDRNYNQRAWNSPSCGTIGCIAGAINQFAGNKVTEVGEQAAIRALGLDPADDEVYSLFDRLFYPRAKWEDDDSLEAPEEEPEYYDATPQQAAKVVRHFMNTGEVDWDKAFED